MSSQVKPDRWIKCISAQGNIRGVAIQATSLVQKMAAMHNVKGVQARGLGEAVMGALLIASYCKPGQRANLNVRGSGHFQQALVDAYADGAVRGYVIARDPGVFDPELGPWGEGILSVLRTKDERGEQPYIGTVPLLTGHLAKDLTFYWAQSEQIPSAVGLAVNLGPDQQVTEAGGFLVQALPGASAAEVKLIEQHINEISNLADSLAKDANPMGLLSQIFQSSTFMVIEERPVEFRCTCSWERVLRALTLVGSTELKEILKEQKAVVRCDFCTQEYLVDSATIQRLLQDLEPAAEKSN